MSRLVSRILLSIFMFPLAVVFYVAVFVFSEQMTRGAPYRRDREMDWFLLADVLTWGAVSLYWCLLWRSAVVWNPRRVSGTMLSAAGALAIGVPAGIAAAAATSELGFGAFIGGILTMILWLIGTVFFWRESKAERAARVTNSGRSAITCPTCGYNLTGLTESRCPECGSKFTLDELLALQQPKLEAEIE